MSICVKICGLTDRSSLESAIDAGADAVGFVFHGRSPRNLSLAQARELAAAVPANVQKVAVMLHPDAQVCEAILKGLAPDVLQTDAGDFDYLTVPDHIERWPVVREHEWAELPTLAGRFVYEGRYSGQGEQVDWARAAILAGRGEMILAGGLNVANVAEAIRTVGPWGVDVSSAVESSPGKKDSRMIREFVSAAKEAARLEEARA